MRQKGNSPTSAQKAPASHRPRVVSPIRHIHGLDYDVLDEMLGYCLRRAQVAMFLSFYEATRGQTITPPRFTALVIIGANPGISQSTLGAALGIARSGAMYLTQWMVDRKLVERRHIPNDGRSWGLHLTGYGRKVTEKMKRGVLAQDRKRSSVLPDQERNELFRLLSKLAG